ncbi:MAG: hypothetical protein R3F59_27565 [Myxococcota bacterium]
MPARRCTVAGAASAGVSGQAELAVDDLGRLARALAAQDGVAAVIGLAWQIRCEIWP